MKIINVLFVTIILIWSNTFAQERSDYHYQRAELLKQSSKYEEAIKSYTAALLDNPEDARSFFGIAEISLNQGNFKYAIRNYQQAIKYQKNNENVIIGLAKSYEGLGEKEKALAQWRKLSVIGVNSENKLIAEKKIVELLNGNVEDKLVGKVGSNPKIDVLDDNANDKLEKNIKVNVSKDISAKKIFKNEPGFYDYKNSDLIKAIELQKAMKDSESLKYCATVLAKYPGHDGAYYYAGVARYNLKDFDKAIYNFKKSFKYPEKGFNAYYYLGRIAEIQSNSLQAISYFNKYLEHTSSESGKKEVLNRISILKKLDTQPKDSANILANDVKDFNLTIKDSIYSGSSEFYKLADALYNREDYFNAIKHYENAISMTKNDSIDSSWGLFQIANIHLLNKSYAKASEFYNIVIERYKTSYWSKQAELKLNEVKWLEENDYLTH